MTAPAPCVKTEPHGPHFWRLQGDYGTASMSRCPGIDPEQGLAPDQDRPTWEVPDLTPEVLNLSDAAALVVRAFNDGQPSSAYYGMVAVWQALCDMTEPEAVTYAFQIATVVPPTRGTVIPL